MTDSNSECRTETAQQDSPTKPAASVVGERVPLRALMRITDDIGLGWHADVVHYSGGRKSVEMTHDDGPSIHLDIEQTGKLLAIFNAIGAR